MSQYNDNLIDELHAEVDRLQAVVVRLTLDKHDLRAEVDRLRARLAQIEAGPGGAAAGDR